MMKKSTCWLGVGLGLLMALAAPSAQAANMEIKALFKPDPSQPAKNEFINQTPNSGYCTEYPGDCAQNNMFSLRLPVDLPRQHGLGPSGAIPITAPANWRKLTVTNRETLETETVEVRITGVGSEFTTYRPVTHTTGEPDVFKAHEKLWSTGSWAHAPSPCESTGVGVFSPYTYRFFWKTPNEATCEKVLLQYLLVAINFRTLDFSYELRMPKPIGMSSGLYTGSLEYTIGETGDFSFGPYVHADDPILTLDFVLDVQHTLKVDLPPGGNKVVLEPAGGWQQWVNGGRKPARIFRDQMFHLSASSRFKVMMLCDEVGGDIYRQSCVMRGGDNSTEVRVFLTLPDGVTHSGGGSPIQRYPLMHNGWSGSFHPTQYVDRRAGLLQFEVDKTNIENLLKPGMSGTLSTNIAVIWDSEV